MAFSLVEVGTTIAKWLAGKALKSAVRILPEEQQEIAEIKETLKSEMEKISDQVRSQSLAKLGSAEIILREGYVHLEGLFEMEVNHEESIQALSAVEKESLEKAFERFLAASDRATEAFMDKKNVGVNQRIAALEIRIFAAVVQHHNNWKKAEASIANIMEDLKRDKEISTIVSNQGKTFFKIAKHPSWPVIEKFIAKVCTLLAEIRIAAISASKSSNSQLMLAGSELSASPGHVLSSLRLPYSICGNVRKVVYGGGELFVHACAGNFVVLCSPVIGNAVMLENQELPLWFHLESHKFYENYYTKSDWACDRMKGKEEKLITKHTRGGSLPKFYRKSVYQSEAQDIGDLPEMMTWTDFDTVRIERCAFSLKESENVLQKVYFDKQKPHYGEKYSLRDPELETDSSGGDYSWSPIDENTLIRLTPKKKTDSNMNTKELVLVTLLENGEVKYSAALEDDAFLNQEFACAGRTADSKIMIAFCNQIRLFGEDVVPVDSNICKTTIGELKLLSNNQLYVEKAGLTYCVVTRVVIFGINH